MFCKFFWILASIISVDIEGQYFLPEIPVVGGGSGTAELGENLGLMLSKVDAAIVQGHGTFAVGGTLEEAYVATTRIEHS
ncbi:MAG: class II aldolase/adducin family protein, partial [Methanosarcinales archaeon]|nr:class II aldolase/adducin family protein [Methanosarcinales archaeon]